MAGVKVCSFAPAIRIYSGFIAGSWCFFRLSDLLMISYCQKDIYKNKIKLTFFASQLKIAGGHCTPLTNA